MRYISRAMILVVMLLVSIAAHGGLADAADGWRLYTAPDHSFSVSFPMAPKRTPIGHGFQLQALPDKHRGYTVMYTRLKGSVEDKQEVFFSTIVFSLQKRGDTLISVNPVRVGGHPGRDIKVRTLSGTIIWDRIFVVGAQFYQLIQATDIENFSPNRFWDSFVLQP